MTNYTHVRLEISGKNGTIADFIDRHLDGGPFIEGAVDVRRADFEGRGSCTVLFLVECLYPDAEMRALEEAWPTLKFRAAYWREGDGSGGIGRASRPVPVLDEDKAFNQATGRAPLDHMEFCPCCGRD